MTTHVHTWHPAEGVTARYRCDCGAWGRRPRCGGEIVEQAATPYNADGPAPTVGVRSVALRPDELHGPSDRTFGVTVGGRAPSLDETERR